MSIAVVVLTHGKLDLLRQCVERVLGRTSPEVTEVVIWDNASSDGSAAYLDTLDDSRVRVVHHPENIGQNAYAEAFALTTADYLVELDDDVIDAPPEWDRTLLDAYLRIPDIGFLAADLQENPHCPASRARHTTYEYTPLEINGVHLLEGPTGGACAMTSREVYDRVGGMPQLKRKTFYLEDAAYIEKVRQHGLRAAVLRDLRVFHAGGDFYAPSAPGRKEYWQRLERAERRKTRVKRLLLALPGVQRANARYGWFEEPAA
jgi:GT2 family glycosyltransferase